jgi:TPR repeat protein
MAMCLLFAACGEKKDEAPATQPAEPAAQLAPSEAAQPAEPAPQPTAPAPGSDPAVEAEFKAAFAKGMLSDDELERFCARGAGEACLQIGLRYSELEDSSGRPKDPRAEERFLRACDLGVAFGCNMAGTIAADDAKRLPLHQKACDRGNGTGCVNVGDHFAGEATGTSVDLGKAAAAYDKGCSLPGGEEGCAKLGQMYKERKGVASDTARAKVLFEKACNADLTWACGEM